MNEEISISNLKSIFIQSSLFTFLVGAGISMDTPSCVPSAYEFTQNLLKLVIPTEYLEKILAFPIRYELMIELWQKYFDHQISFLDYLEIITLPNLLHFFLAYVLLKEHYVITTNFDYLIERAIINLNLLKDIKNQFVPIITRDDFSNFIDQKLYQEKEKLFLFKIHGCKRNFITGEDTTDSLITTMKSLGKNRKSGETFGVEPFKIPVLNQIFNNRTLIFMGYSGQDAFDLVPFLKNYPTLKRLIWIVHKQADIKIIHIQATETPNNSSIINFLETLAKKGNYEIILIIGETKEIVNQILSPLILGHQANKNNIQIEKTPLFPEWIKTNSKIIQDIQSQYLFMYDIAQLMNNGDFAIEIATKGLKLAQSSKHFRLQSIWLNNLGWIYYAQKGDLDIALNYYKKSIQISEENNLISDNAVYSNISQIYINRGEWDRAIQMLKKLISLSESSNDNEAICTALISLGAVYDDKGEWDQSIKCYTQAIEIIEKMGDLKRKGIAFSNLGRIYEQKGELEIAFKYLQDALAIANEFNDIKEKALALNHLGLLSLKQENPSQAKKYFNDSKDYLDLIGNRNFIAPILNNFGQYYSKICDWDNALSYYKQALIIDEKIGDLSGIAKDLINIGYIYDAKEEYTKAFESYERAQKIAEKLGDRGSLAALFNNIGDIYLQKNDKKTALLNYKKSLELSTQMDAYSLIKMLQLKIEKLNKLGITSLETKKAGKVKGILFLSDQKLNPQELNLHLKNYSDEFTEWARKTENYDFEPYCEMKLAVVDPLTNNEEQLEMLLYSSMGQVWEKVFQKLPYMKNLRYKKFKNVIGDCLVIWELSESGTSVSPLEQSITVSKELAAHKNTNFSPEYIKNVVKYKERFERTIAPGIIGTYEEYTAPSRIIAIEFLKSYEIKKQYFYVEVQTPEGAIAKDIKGIY